MVDEFIANTELYEKMKKERKELFRRLGTTNVNEHTETKNDLTYLSWAWAWQQLLEACPDAEYEIRQFQDKDGVWRCYQYDPNLGYMVFTSITCKGLKREMWLPVMDGANKAMKDHEYTYVVKSFEKTVQAATMFDINKTIMRCLTKNIAMFGLGLYIYAGEDLPAEIKEPDPLITAEQLARIRELEIIEPNVCKKFKIKSIEELTQAQADFVIKTKEKALEQEKPTKKAGK